MAIPKLTASLILRNDSVGQGHFGAPRGERTHNGIDYLAPPGTIILSPVSGRVSKIGYPYADDLSYRYIQITHGISNREHCHRFFYVDPSIVRKLDDWISIGDPLGVVQDISERYGETCLPHVHWEVKDGDTYIDLEELDYI